MLKRFTPYFIIAALVAFIIIDRCEPSETLHADFVVNNPAPVKVLPVAAAKIKEFKDLGDLKKVEVYKEAITKREYKQEFKSKGHTITVEAETTGTLDLLKVDYQGDPVKTRSHFYLGGELNLGPIGPAVIVKGYLVTDKLIYSGGYDFQNKGVTIGAAYKLF